MEGEIMGQCGSCNKDMVCVESCSHDGGGGGH